MDNNGNGGTPNPLNPSIDGFRTTPAANPVNPAAPSPASPAPAANPTPTANPLVPGAPATRPTTPNTVNPPTTSPANPTPAVSPAAPKPSATTIAKNPNSLDQPLDPTGRTMEQATAGPDEAPKKSNKKKKIGFIVFIAAVALLLVGGIVAAAVLSNTGNDPVTLAMKKIISGEAPSNVTINGDIDFRFNTAGSLISRINLNLNSSIAVETRINDSAATLTITDDKGKESSIKFSEIYSANGDLFFRVDGVDTATKDANLLNLMNTISKEVDDEGFEFEDIEGDDIGVDSDEEEYVEDIEEDEGEDEEGDESEGEDEDEGELEIEGGDLGDNNLDDVDPGLTTVDTVKPNGSGSGGSAELLQSDLMTVIEKNNGVWIKISVNELAQLNNGVSTQYDTNCATDLASGISKNNATIANFYDQYPFIEPTRNNVTVQSKQSPVYRIGINSEKFANFMNALNNSAASENWGSCMGDTKNKTVDTNEVANIVDKLPTIYAEVNDEYNFSRLYLEYNTADKSATLTADLDFSYPASVNVSEPAEYINFTDALKKLNQQVLEGGAVKE